MRKQNSLLLVIAIAAKKVHNHTIPILLIVGHILWGIRT